MQNSMSDTRVLYRERLSPSLPLMVTVALAGPMASLVFVPLGTTLALAIGVGVSLAFVGALVGLAPVVTVEGSTLRAGRAHIDVRFLGTPVAHTGEDARHARGPGLSARSWHLIRGSVDGLVTVPNTDSADPVDVWAISSRTPDRLAAAIQRAAAGHAG